MLLIGILPGRSVCVAIPGEIVVISAGKHIGIA